MQERVLPIKLESGKTTFASAVPEGSSFAFAIMENNNQWHAFKDKVPILDFSLGEIEDTKPLLLALGLGAQFSSRLVKVVREVKGSILHREMTNELRNKSRAIAR